MYVCMIMNFFVFAVSITSLFWYSSACMFSVYNERKSTSDFKVSMRQKIDKAENEHHHRYIYQLFDI